MLNINSLLCKILSVQFADAFFLNLINFTIQNYFVDVKGLSGHSDHRSDTNSLLLILSFSIKFSANRNHITALEDSDCLKFFFYHRDSPL